MATHRTPPPPSRRSRWKLFRIAHGHRRLLLAFTLALFIFAALTAFGIGHAATRFLIGWDVALLLYLIVTFFRIGRFDLRQVQLHAAEQDEGAIVMLGLTVLAAIASFVAVIAFLGGAKEAANLKGLYFAFAVFTILLSWCAIHTIFALHYAHEFYGDGRDRRKGGLIFPGDTQPDHWDFMYFSFVVGMTFQVSDVQITSKSLRHVVVAHGIVSFLFSVAILALAVNIGSGLI